MNRLLCQVSDALKTGDSVLGRATALWLCGSMLLAGNLLLVPVPNGLASCCEKILSHNFLSIKEISVWQFLIHEPVNFYSIRTHIHFSSSLTLCLTS